MMTAKVGGVCGAILLACSLFSNRTIAGQENKLTQLMDRQGLYESFTVDQLNTKQQEFITKHQNYSSVRLNSEISYFLKRIPDLLPTGAWLSSMSIGYADIDPKAKKKRTKDKFQKNS